MNATELIPLPGTEWRVWRDALLRATGFPMAGLERLSAPDAAAVADAFLTGTATEEEFAAAFEKAGAAVGGELYDIAEDPLFREAITWQNTNALHALDGPSRSGPDGRRNNKRREREELIARYWQRYCAKNDTIGFFGPVCWVRLDADGPAVRGGPGAGLIRQRRVFFERRALEALAERLAADPDIRRWLPVALQPGLHFVVTNKGGAVKRAALPPIPLNAAETAVLRCVTAAGSAPAARIAALGDDHGFRKDDDVYLVLDRLVERGVLRWGADLPMDLSPERRLAEQLAAIGDPAARQRATSAFERLVAARDRVAAAAGDPHALAAEMSHLDAEFTEVTGADPRHRRGETYVGRALCHEDTVRDLDLTFGGDLLAELAGPLDILLHAARWLTVEIAAAYKKALRVLYTDLTGGGGGELPLADLWYLAQGLMFGEGERPVDAVTAEFVRRWAGLFGLDARGSEGPIQFSSAELADRVRETFPAERPGWLAARMHSPDLQIAATSREALARGEYTVVLGEMHAAWMTCDSAIFLELHEDAARLREAAARDIGVGRVMPLYPVDWPLTTARIAETLTDDRNWQLGFQPAPGADHRRLLSVTALTVADVDGDLVVRDGAGRSWPLPEFYGEFLSIHAVNAFKLVSAAPHTPRVSIDRFVVARETWRTTVAETGLAEVKGYANRFLAARRWRVELGLPERVFARIGTEIKPCYVDFTSPPLVLSFCSMLRGARIAHGGEIPVVVSELLPGVGEAWVPGARGETYASELRIFVRDPRAADTPALPVPPTAIPATAIPATEGDVHA